MISFSGFVIPGNSVSTIFSASFGSISDLGIGTIRNLLKYPLDLLLVLVSSFRQKRFLHALIFLANDSSDYQEQR